MTPLAGNRENLWQISIHMPHTWHDNPQCSNYKQVVKISIHMPHTWHDRWLYLDLSGQAHFNPHATYVA